MIMGGVRVMLGSYCVTVLPGIAQNHQGMVSCSVSKVQFVPHEFEFSKCRNTLPY